jgi:ABC-type amino acid transport substrate-binding protein
VTVKSLAFFGEYRFVYPRGVASYEPILKYFKNTYAVVTDKQMWKMIQLGRADITTAGRINGLYTLKKLGIEGIYPLDPPLNQWPLYHFLHKKHKKLVPKIDQVLKKWAESGELKRLRAQAIENLLTTVQK